MKSLAFLTILVYKNAIHSWLDGKSYLWIISLEIKVLVNF